MSMGATPTGADDVFDQFLTDRGHETEPVGWEQNRRKKQCPDCGGLHDDAATSCTVCGWTPAR